MEPDHRPLRSYDVRERNEKLVLSLIYNRGLISQSEVVSVTGLKPPTVFRIFASLERKRYIRISESEREQAERKGRKPLYYRIEPDTHYVIGVDFWARSATVVVVNFGRTPVYEKVFDFQSDPDGELVVRDLEALIREAIDSAGIPSDKILGIGIGAPGIVDLKRGVILYYPRIRGMVDFNIRDRLEQAFSVPVYIHNNSSVMALSEYRYGKARDFGSLLLILLRSGLGGSFIGSGSVFVNQNQTAMEIGHITQEQEGRPCWCGGRGCLETQLSEDAIVADLAEKAGILSFEQVGPALQRGDPAVLHLLTAKAKLLGLCVRNLHRLFRPQAFLIVTREQALSDFLAAVVRDTLSPPGAARPGADRPGADRPGADRPAQRGLPRAVFRTPAGAALLGEPVIIADKYDPIIAGRGATDLVFDPFFQIVPEKGS